VGRRSGNIPLNRHRRASGCVPRPHAPVFGSDRPPRRSELLTLNSTAGDVVVTCPSPSVRPPDSSLPSTACSRHREPTTGNTHAHTQIIIIVGGSIRGGRRNPWNRRVVTASRLAATGQKEGFLFSFFFFLFTPPSSHQRSPETPAASASASSSSSSSASASSSSSAAEPL